MIFENNINLMQLLQNLIRVGKVSSINPKEGTVKVVFPDKDNFVSYDLPVIVPQTMKNKDYYMPDIDEQVVCIFLPNGIQQGFVLGAIYSKRDIPPVADPNKRHIKFEDGTWIEYDRKNHVLSVDCIGDVNIKGANSVKIEGPGGISLIGDITVVGNVSVTENINAGGSIIDTTGNSNHHSH